MRSSFSSGLQDELPMALAQCQGDTLRPSPPRTQSEIGTSLLALGSREFAFAATEHHLPPDSRFSWTCIDMSCAPGTAEGSPRLRLQHTNRPFPMPINPAKSPDSYEQEGFAIRLVSNQRPFPLVRNFSGGRAANRDAAPRNFGSCSAGLSGGLFSREADIRGPNMKD